LLKMNNFSLTSGDWLILAATLLWSIETIISKKALENINSKIVAWGRMFFGSLIILVFLAATNKIFLIMTLTSSQLGWIIITSIFLFGYVLTWYSGLKHIKATVATSILLLGSVITTALDLAFSKLTINTAQSLGMVLLILGVASIIGFTTILKKLKKLQSSFSIAKAQ